MNKPNPDSTTTNVTESQHWLCRPWWGYACLCLTGTMAIHGIADAVQVVLGPDLHGLAEGVGGLLIFGMFGGLVTGLVSRRHPGVPTCTDRTWIRKALALLAIGVIGSFLSLVGRASTAASNAAAEANAVWESRTFANERGAIEVPSTWKPGALTNTAPDQLNLDHPATDRHLLVTAIPKADVTLRTLEEVSQAASEQLAATMTNVMATDPRQLTVNSRPAIDRRFDATTEGTNITFLQRHIEYPEHWLEVRIWTTVSRLDDSVPVFQRIIDSLRFD